MIIFSNKHYKNKRLFEELMNGKPETLKLLVSDNTSKESELDINAELVTIILKNLEKFERNKK